MLNNKSTSISETGEKIYAQEINRINPARGFGSINYIIAGRVFWRVFDNEQGRLSIEPYALYNSDPEQTIEFRGDASSKLGTIGTSIEYTNPTWEYGFEYAFNLGRQLVKPWDRNQIVFENRLGQAVIVNSRVTSESDGARIPFVDRSTAQNIINATPKLETQNGQVIGTVDAGVGYLPGPVTMVNADTRFRPGYTNKYEGWMFITDMSYWICPKTVQLAAMAGVASGDRNPNEDVRDGTFSGFIGLQEIYSGKRVNSAFFLGGAGKPPRPLAIPSEVQAPNRFAQSVSRFTNLVVAGGALYWEPSTIFNVKTNAIAYWQQVTTPKFDAQTQTELNQPASNYLGLEQNLFLSYMPITNTRMYFVGSIFFPGQHYSDVRGIPLNADQERALERLNTSGFDDDRVPNLGDNASFTINLGIEYLF